MDFVSFGATVILKSLPLGHSRRTSALASAVPVTASGFPSRSVTMRAAPDRVARRIGLPARLSDESLPVCSNRAAPRGVLTAAAVLPEIADAPQFHSRR